MTRKGFLKLAAAGGAGLAVASCFLRSCQKGDVFREFGAKLTAERMKAFEGLPNWAAGEFKNVEPTFLKTHSSTVSLSKNLHWLFFPENKAPENLHPQSVPADAFGAVPAGNLRLCWLGHSSLIFELAGMRFATDLVFENAAPVPWVVGRYCEPPFPRERLPKLDFVIVSHDHYDHLERATVKFLAETQAELKFITCLGVGAHLRHWGVPAERIVEMNWGDSVSEGSLKIHCVTSRHFSGRALDTRNQTLWGAFVIEGAGTRVFFGGDGGYGNHFKSIAGAFPGGFDLALFEIDAWNENWPQIHITPEDAVLAGTELGARCLMPVHWATFYLARHPWKQSVELFLSAAEKRGVRTLFPPLGRIVDFSEALPQNPWWREID